MLNRIIFLLLAAFLMVLLDFYVFQAVKTVTRNWNNTATRSIHILYWTINILAVSSFLFLLLGNPELLNRQVRTFIGVGIFMVFFSKIMVALFLVIDDVRRFGQWAFQQVKPSSEPKGESEGISRSEFLAKTGLLMGGLPMGAMLYGIISGAHDYRIRRLSVSLPNLPSEFDGLKICQISDIHSGSFYKKDPVNRGVDMLLNEKPDVVFFTGDLVNNVASEIENHQEIFERISAPMGVYSVLGNHDYGDYVRWDSQEEKRANLERLKEIHKEMGWRLLMNEHEVLERNGQQIAVLGIENWSAKGRFPKHGDLAKAHQGTENIPVKLLLSHDPSHWDAQVRSDYKDIDIMFAGHTHGAQFGVEIPGLKWSPVKYMYEKWAGLYQEGSQYLYVNRGFGYLGFPGRIGILPEITILELKTA
ncbi:metallophosphoesterase [Flammeovirgaceae bacterium SG7u.111]|nr:metallophosphoesterase [Flammeovirgaceae bacterium SG7u.132]WPO35210.1 metallophosphoesterase [Flammeovirgaceae bacterium SG7u.111]